MHCLCLAKLGIDAQYFPDNLTLEKGQSIGFLEYKYLPSSQFVSYF